MAGSIAVVKFSGELEVSRRREIAAALRVPRGASGVLLDFGEVTYADSTSLAELLRFRKDAAAEGVPIAILTGTRQFRRLVEYAGLTEAFAIFEDRAAALDHLERRAAR